MIGLIQRVMEARVEVTGETIAAIDSGLLVLVGFRRHDRVEKLDRFLQRLLNYRVFADENGRMNLSLRDVGGGLLLVPQFTLAADTNSGNRPSFTPAASPDDGQVLFESLVTRARNTWPDTATGEFGAHMQVHLVNDGPVTFLIEVD